MVSLQSQFRRIHILFFSLLILFCITAAPDRQWAKAPAAAVCPTITLGPNLVQNGTVGSPYSLNLTASGGRAPYAYSRISGTLPTGLFLSSGGTIGGTPTQAAGFSFRIRASDADGCPGEKSYAITVVCPTITLSPGTLPSATIGVSYSQSISASGGQSPYTYSVTSGSTPPGMFLGPNGSFGGTPNATGPYSFTVRVTDANNCMDTRSYTLNVNCPDIAIAPSTPPGGTVGASYLQNLFASGGQGPYTFSLFLGALAPGLSLSSSGAITGTPTSAGSYVFTVQVRDANDCESIRIRTIVIDPGCPPITITPLGLPDASTGIAYSQPLNATGGGDRYSFSIVANSLPPGLTLLPTGLISGTPTTTGTYSFQVQATGPNGCTGTRAYTIVVNCGTITLTPGSLPNATVGVPYSQTVSASGTRSPYGFTSTGTLPPGITLNSFGALLGTPTAAGNYSFSLRVSDGNNCFTDKPYTINVTCPTITVNPANLPAGTTGTAYSQTFSATGGKAPYQFGMNISALPPGLTFNTNGSLSGTPTVAGSYSFLVVATDANGCFGERSYTLVINRACPTITLNPTNPALPNAQVGLNYNHNFTATGGAAPYTFSANQTPVGLTLRADGLLYGVPTTAGNFGFFVKATDANGCEVQRLYNLSILSCPIITVNPTDSTLPTAQFGVAYSHTFTATGGIAPYTFRANLTPPGLTLTSGGLLTGTPTVAGIASFELRATDSTGCTGLRAYRLDINNSACPVITVNPANAALPAGTTGVGYNHTFTATGGVAPYSFIISSGTLPPGLSLASNGNLTGTPTTTGNYSFTVRAADANNCVGVRSYTLVINNTACPTITVNPATLPVGQVGLSYSQTFPATGGTAPYAFSLSTGTLPTGLSLASNANLTGTPTAAGSHIFTARATDANGCTGERGYTLVINNPACPAITVNPATLPAGVTGTAYNQTFTATGGTASYAFSIPTGTLPTGLSLASNGNLTGTPTAAGSYSFSVRATDANGCAGERPYTIVITNPACPAITLNPTTLPAGTSGTAYNQTFTATGGAAAYAFSISTGTLPTGLSLASNGALAGTPTAAGTYTFSVRATDANGCAGERPYTIAVGNPECPAIALNPTTLPAATTGTAYNQTVTATGGAGSYAFSVSSGALPAGVSLAASGSLTGAPSAAGSFSFTVRATNAGGCTGERSYTIAVANNLVTSVSAASFSASGGLAPESIVAAFGSNMATSTQIATTLPLPTTLAGVTLKVRDSAGVERLAPLFFVSTTQINSQIPPGTVAGSASVTVENGAGNFSPAAVVATGTIEVATVSPGLFSADASGRGVAAANVLRIKADGTQSYEAIARFDTAQNRFVAVPIDLGPATDQLFLVLYGTGFKFRSALSAVGCTIGGVSGEVLYAGEVAGLAGLDQINARLPRALAGRGEVDVVIVVDGRTANTVRVAVR